MCVCALPSVRTGPQNPEGASGGPGQRPVKDQASRRKDEAKQAAKKPKEKENALSQFDLNNYASESHTHQLTHTHTHTHTQTIPESRGTEHSLCSLSSVAPPLPPGVGSYGQPPA